MYNTMSRNPYRPRARRILTPLSLTVALAVALLLLRINGTSNENSSLRKILLESNKRSVRAMVNLRALEQQHREPQAEIEQRHIAQQHDARVQDYAHARPGSTQLHSRGLQHNAHPIKMVNVRGGHKDVSVKTKTGLAARALITHAHSQLVQQNGREGQKKGCNRVSLDVLQAHYRAGATQRDSMLLAKRLAEHCTGEAIAITVLSSVTQICMLDNFLTFVDALPSAPPTVVSNLDRGGFDGCTKLAARMDHHSVVCAKNFVRPGGANMVGSKVSYGSRLWRKMVWKKPAMVLAALDAGLTTYFSDIDLILLRDPTSVLHKYPHNQVLVSCQGEEADTQLNIASRDVADGANIGSLFVHPKRRDFVAKWSATRGSFAIDQDGFREILKTQGTQDVHCLKRTEFAFVTEKLDRSSRSEVVSYHFILAKDKPASMAKVGVWQPRIFSQSDCGFVAGGRAHIFNKKDNDNIKHR